MIIGELTWWLSNELVGCHRDTDISQSELFNAQMGNLCITAYYYGWMAVFCFVALIAIVQWRCVLISWLLVLVSFIRLGNGFDMCRKVNFTNLFTEYSIKWIEFSPRIHSVFAWILFFSHWHFYHITVKQIRGLLCLAKVKPMQEAFEIV